MMKFLDPLSTPTSSSSSSASTLSSKKVKKPKVDPFALAKELTERSQRLAAERMAAANAVAQETAATANALALSRSTDRLTIAGSDGHSTKSSIAQSSTHNNKAASIRTASSSGSSIHSSSTKSTSTSNSSAAKSAAWKAAVDPLSMSSKSMGPGFMPSFSTHLYSPGFQAPASAAATANPKAYQSKQLEFVEKKNRPGSTRTGSGSPSSSTTSLGLKQSQEKEKAKSVQSGKSSFFSSFSGSAYGDTPAMPTTPPATTTSEATAAAAVTTAVGGASVLSSTSSSSSKSEFPRPPSDYPQQHPSQLEQLQHYRQYQQQLKSPVNPAPPTLLIKRVTSWEYLGRVHMGKMAFYNTMILTESELQRFFTPDQVQRRTHHYFLLGTSIAKVLEIRHLGDFAKSLAMVLHEFDEFLAGEMQPKSKMNFFKSGKSVEDTNTIHLSNGEFSHFEARSLPFEMDYTITFATLCEIIAESYKRFHPKDLFEEGVADATSLAVQAKQAAAHIAAIDPELFNKIDNRLKKISNACTKDLELLAREAMEEELSMLDPMSLLQDAGWDHPPLPQHTAY